MLTGGCLCGAVRYEIRADAIQMYYCHCSQCRRASGSSFTTNALVQSEDFSLLSGERVLAAYESSPAKLRHFCSQCGSPIFSRSEALPSILSLRCGTLDGDPGSRPLVHIYVDSKSAWFEMLDGLPQHAEGLVPDTNQQ